METSSDITNLLRPNQVAEMQDELRGLEEMLNAPPHIRAQISDRPGMRKRADRLKKDAEKYTPRAYAPTDRDAAVKEFEALAESIKEGMPSSEEMRRNPPGAVGKQIAWDKRNKQTVARYKHIALRLQAGGDLPLNLRNAGDAANIELLRPLTTNRQLGMDGAQIPKTTNFHFGADVAGTVLFSAEEMAVLTAKAPAVAGSLAVLDNAARADIKRLLGSLMAPATPAPEVVKDEKPTIKSLGYNGMKKLAAEHGVDCKNIKMPELITKLRDRHLIT